MSSRVLLLFKTNTGFTPGRSCSLLLWKTRGSHQRRMVLFKVPAVEFFSLFENKKRVRTKQNWTGVFQTVCPSLLNIYRVQTRYNDSAAIRGFTPDKTLDVTLFHTARPLMQNKYRLHTRAAVSSRYAKQMRGFTPDKTVDGAFHTARRSIPPRHPNTSQSIYVLRPEPCLPYLDVLKKSVRVPFSPFAGKRPAQSEGA